MNKEEIIIEKEKEIKELLLKKEKASFSWVETEYTFPTEKHRKFNEPFSNKLIQLSKNGVLIVQEEIYGPLHTKDHDIDNLLKCKNKITPYNKCSLSQKKAIKEKKEQISTILKDETDKYDKKGKVIIPIKTFANNSLGVLSWDMELEVTQRELAEAGISPEDLSWEPMLEVEKGDKKEITSTEIAKASKDRAVTKNEEKGIWSKLVNKIKNMFNERVE